VLSCRNVCKRYLSAPDVSGQNESAKNSVLFDFSCEFTAPRTCIVGSNGTGKSTLLLILAGLLMPNSGQVLWDNKPSTPEQRKARVALASDSIVIPSFLSAAQVLKLVQDTWKTAWPEQLIEQFYFAPFLHTKVDNLSTGSLKKLQLIAALMRKPEVLLLDEPNIALDEQSVAALWKIISHYPHAIIVASNEPDVFTQRQFVLQNLSHKKTASY